MLRVPGGALAVAWVTGAVPVVARALVLAAAFVVEHAQVEVVVCFQAEAYLVAGRDTPAPRVSVVAALVYLHPTGMNGYLHVVARL